MIGNYLRTTRTVRVFRRPVPWPIAAAATVIIVTLWLAPYWLNQGKWQTFRSDQYHFSIEYPANWTVGVYGEGGYRGNDYLRALFYHLLAPGHVRIHTVSLENPSLADAVKWGETIIARHRGNYLSGPADATIGSEGYAALVRTYTRPADHQLVRVVYVVSRNEALALEFTAKARRYSEAEEIFDRMLSSFRLGE